MSIFTHTFPKFVKRQLEDRANILSLGNELSTNPSTINGRTAAVKEPIPGKPGKFKIKYPAGAFYTNTVEKQCVIRLCSGVDLSSIGEKTVLVNKKEKDRWKGSNLSRKWVLEGGIPMTFSTKVDDDEWKVTHQTQRGGFNASIDASQDYYASTGLGSYGDPSTRSDAGDGYGIVPMPGITDASIKVKSAYGSLREAKVNFVCHNRRQLEILELLYMRPGYTLLLEYGWTPHIKTSLSTNITTKSSDFFVMDEFFKKQSDMSKLNNAILEKKKEAGGNYDACLGVCKNFEIKARADGGYDCSTTIITMGEVLEGLKGKRDFPPIQMDEDEDAQVYDNFEVYLMALQQKMRSTEGLQKFQEQSWLKRFADDMVGFIGVNIGYNYASRMAANPFLHNISPHFEEAYKSILAPGSGIQIFKFGEDEAMNTEGGTKVTKISKWEAWKGAMFDSDFFDPDGRYRKLMKLNADPQYLDSFLLHKGERLGFDKDGNSTLGRAQHEYIRWDFLCELLNKFILENATAPHDNAVEKQLLSIQYSNNTEESPDDSGEYLDYSNYTFKPKVTVPIELSATQANSNVTGSSGTTENSRGEVRVDISEVMDGSMNPEICLLPHQINPSDPDRKPEGTLLLGRKTFGATGKKKITAHNRSIGLIYLNVNHLLQTYRSMRYDGEGGDAEDFSFLKYIKKIWEEDVNGACAGTHDFIFQMPNNIGRIIDVGYQGALKPEDLYEFKIQSNKSLLRDFNFNTTIDKKLSSQISVAAQNTKNVQNLDQLSFAAFCKNITNRFATEEVEEDKLRESRENMEKDVVALASQLYNYKLEMITESYNEEDNDKKGQTINVSNACKKAQLLQTKVLQLSMTYPLICPPGKDQEYDADNQYGTEGCVAGGKHPAAGRRREGATISRSSIIPLKFNGLMDGIGGMVIGNVFRIEPDKLPIGYQGDDIAFVLLGINHKITGGQDWTTEISGQLILLNSEAQDGKESTTLETYQIGEIKGHLRGDSLYSGAKVGEINLTTGKPEYVRDPEAARVIQYVDNTYTDSHLSEYYLTPGGNQSPLTGFVTEKTHAGSSGATSWDPFPQLDSGGPLEPQMSKMLIYVLKMIKRWTDDPPGIGAWQEWTGAKNRFHVGNDDDHKFPLRSKTNPYHITLTGGNDLHHHEKVDYFSYHTTGFAVDFTISPAEPENVEEIERILQRLVIGHTVGATNLPGMGGGEAEKSYFRYKNEYKGGLSENKKGDYHFHIMYSVDGIRGDGQKEMEEAKKRHEAGDLFAGGLTGDGPGVFGGGTTFII